MKKFLFSLCLFMLGLYSCTTEENVSNICDIPSCVSDIIPKDVVTKDVSTNDSGIIDMEEKTFCSEAEELVLSNSEPVANAEIDFEFGSVSFIGEKDGSSAKTQFKTIFKKSEVYKIKTGSNGEFSIEISKEDLGKLPEYFEILFVINPPNDFGKEYKTNKSIISFYRYEITRFNFVLTYNDGYFIVTPHEQLYKLVTKSSGGKKALDAFINATIKAVVPDKAEPVPGAEIIIDRPLDPNKKKDKKKSMFFSDTGVTENIVVQCYEFEVGSEIVTTSDYEGYFSFKPSASNDEYILFTIIPGKGSSYEYEAASYLVYMPKTADEIYDMMLVFEKRENEKGRFIIVGPIPFQPCSQFNNPICKPTRCKMIGGQIGKCQYLYFSATNEYKCGCFHELCPPDCTGTCRMPNGMNGFCHIEQIISIVDGVEVVNKSCVCGPINITCNTACQTDVDCISQTQGQFPVCATDMFGSKFCTKGCSDVSECQTPFSMCAKMGPEGRGICICPCKHVDNFNVNCSPIGMYNQHCSNVTYGLLTDCVDLDGDLYGECTNCCNDDNDCPAGLSCYDLPNPLSDKCKKACMCKEPPVQKLCKECSTNQDCAINEVCVDEDNNPNTPKVCTVPCGSMGNCPTSPVYTYCDFNVSKYCLCKHPAPAVDCNYECKDNQDCLLSSNGQLDLCIADLNGVKRCTKSCNNAGECPSPYSMCIKYGDKSFCACPCIHFDTDEVSCTQYGFNIPQCIGITNNALSDCFDIDNDGTGECTRCCNDNKDCPANMMCTSVNNAKCSKVCTCREHPLVDICQMCSQNSDCPSGFVCADDDNNSATPNVCTRVCPSVYPCPTSPVYTYCDSNISKYCICNQSGTNLCETKCEKNSDCPSGLICADDDINPLTPKICTKTCGDCPAPMICNNDANLPVAVCMCPRKLCKECKEDVDCGYGYKCLDTDGDPITPKVCSVDCSSDFECPLNLSCNLNTKSCDCNRCSKWSNEMCDPVTCYKNGVFGKCKRVMERCDCVTEALNICQECKYDYECAAPLKCVDADNNPNTPNICSEQCSVNMCQPPAVCDLNVSKYCFCK
ncbi:MAG: hypothetical protein N2746_03570 [Deltaproteobacteria bacterium]|nr:hypothetical protein [Deltaproteobacteria bacterium]